MDCAVVGSVRVQYDRECRDKNSRCPPVLCGPARSRRDVHVVLTLHSRWVAVDLHGAYDLSLLRYSDKKICVIRSPPSFASCMLALRYCPSIIQHVLFIHSIHCPHTNNLILRPNSNHTSSVDCSTRLTKRRHSIVLERDIID